MINTTTDKSTLIKWHFREALDGQGYYAEREDGRKEEVFDHSHCRACAMAELISRECDADVDLRGLNYRSPCVQFLAVMVRQRRDEKR